MQIALSFDIFPRLGELENMIDQVLVVLAFSVLIFIVVTLVYTPNNNAE